MEMMRKIGVNLEKFSVFQCSKRRNWNNKEGKIKICHSENQTQKST